MKPQSRRVKKYAKNDREENIYLEMNKALLPVEARITSCSDAPKYPVVFIVGAQRSGTTLLMQALNRFFHIGYVSNLMARFWLVPALGAMLAASLRKGPDDGGAEGYNSDLGYTSGPEGEHEFGYFWRNWFPVGETHRLSPRQIEAFDGVGLVREIAAMEQSWGAPMVFKNPVICNFHIDLLSSLLPRSLFLHCVRDPLYAAQSTLESRRKLFGSSQSWFGPRPPECREVLGKRPEEQIVAQIYYIRRWIDSSFSCLDPTRHMTVRYEDLCANPMETLSSINKKLDALGANIKPRNRHMTQFTFANVQRLGDEEFDVLRKLVEHYFPGETAKHG